MSAPDYAAIVRALVTILRDNLDGVHVTDDPDEPTMDQCPAVQVWFGGFTRTPVRMVGFQYGVGGFNEDLSLTIRCSAFSGQGAADARLQRDTLVQQVQTVMGNNFQLNGTVQYAYVTGGQPLGKTDDGGCYAGADLTVTARTTS